MTKLTLQLIHYGANKYNPDLFRLIKNRDWVKPTGGLWASPVESDHSWRHWCEAEGQEVKQEEYFIFEYTGNTFVIDNAIDMEQLPWFNKCPGMDCISFELLANEWEVDAIYLTEKGEHDTRWNHPRSLYGWDCESILIMNPECIEERIRKGISKEKVQVEE